MKLFLFITIVLFSGCCNNKNAAQQIAAFSKELERYDHEWIATLSSTKKINFIVVINSCNIEDYRNASYKILDITQNKKYSLVRVETVMNCRKQNEGNARERTDPTVLHEWILENMTTKQKNEFRKERK